MKKITLFFCFLFVAMSASAQFSNFTVPTQVKTNAAGSTDNVYAFTFDYTFADETDVNTMAYFTVRIRPITDTGAKDAPANTDIVIDLVTFKDYVVNNGFTGTYSGQVIMPEDSVLPTTASRNAANAGYGYDTRLQWGYGALNLQSPFTGIEVFDSSATLSLDDNAITSKLISVYPNPTSGKFYISNFNEFKSIEIFNVVGKKVKTMASNNALDISDLATGIYILKTNTGISKKIVKN